MAKQGLAFRATIALTLMIGFYALALAVAGGLAWIPYAEWRYAHRLHPKLALGCLAAAFTVLYAIFPRPDRFEPPGPELEPADQPRLFGLIRDVASATSQAMPSHVYLLSEVNAFVSHRGGVMGIGSRRVMGIGLPLLQGLTVPELRSVIAHEFGHYVGGDVALAPWIYKTRMAIGRAIAQLGDSALTWLFNAYGRLFMRLTMAISRQQEFVADAIAAQIGGVDPAAGALRRVAVMAAAYDAYMRSDVLPVLQSGYLPPLADGFDRFRTSSGFEKSAAALIEHAVSTGETTDFDTHPALRDRLDALARLPSTSVVADTTPASTLVDGIESLARTLVEHSAGHEKVAQLRPIDWPAVATAVYQPMWAAHAEHCRPQLSSFTTTTMPVGLGAYATLGRAMIPRVRIEVSNEECVNTAIGAVGSALATQLAGQGWTIHTNPGEVVELRRGDHAIAPFETVGALARGKLDVAQWSSLCERLGIAGLSLTAVQPSPSAATSER